MAVLFPLIFIQAAWKRVRYGPIQGRGQRKRLERATYSQHACFENSYVSASGRKGGKEWRGLSSSAWPLPACAAVTRGCLEAGLRGSLLLLLLAGRGLGERVCKGAAPFLSGLGAPLINHPTWTFNLVSLCIICFPCNWRCDELSKKLIKNQIQSRSCNFQSGWGRVSCFSLRECCVVFRAWFELRIQREAPQILERRWRDFGSREPRRAETWFMEPESQNIPIFWPLWKISGFCNSLNSWEIDAHVIFKSTLKFSFLKYLFVQQNCWRSQAPINVQCLNPVSM